MGSENKMNDGTSFEQSDKPILCANGCGFFGTPAMMNLCSKCYGDHRMKEEQAASAKIAVEKSMNSLSHLSSPSASAASTLVIQDEKKVTAAVVGASSSEKDVAVAPPKATNRCGSCNKKVGVMGFKCKCGCTFCGAHRYPEEHGCTFDFKGAGRDGIAKANPVVKADKVERF